VPKSIQQDAEPFCGPTSEDIFQISNAPGCPGNRFTQNTDLPTTCFTLT
jgi:hypothetical protein